MDLLRTPDEAFANLPGYDFGPNYTEVDDLDGGTLRIHHVDEGPADAAETVLLMHGEPSWSYLYRHMIPVLNDAGIRTVAPDLVGFGRSDKPANREDHTYERHVAWMSSWLVANDLRGLTIVCQDWGGLIGLRLLAALNRFPPRSSIIHCCYDSARARLTDSPRTACNRLAGRPIAQTPHGLLAL